MRKIIKQICVLILAVMLIGLTGSVYAADATSGTLKVQAASEVEQGKEFDVAINLSNFSTTSSIVAIIGKIEYDKDKLEYVSITSNTEAGWDDIDDTSFDEESMGFILENRKAGKLGANDNLLNIKFKAKSNVEGNAYVRVKVSSASESSNFPGDEITVKVTKPEEVKSPEPSPEVTPSVKPSETPGTTESPKVETSASPSAVPASSTPSGEMPTRLPQTGDHAILFYGLALIPAVALVISVVIYRKRISIKAKK